MPKFTKPLHFVNFIRHTEAYKKEFFGLSQQNSHKSDENWNAWVPGGESLKNKLFGYVKH